MSERKHTSEQIVQRKHTSGQIVQRKHTSEQIVQRKHTSEQIVQRKHTSEQIVQRKHTSEQIVQRSRRSEEDYVNREKIKVTLRRTEKQSEMEVVGTPSRVGRFLQDVCGDQRTATSSSRGARLPQVPHRSQELLTSSVKSHREPRSSQHSSSRIQAPRNSQVVEDFHSTRAVRNFPRYGRCQTSSSTNYSTAPQATYPSRPKVESKDGVTKSARAGRPGCVAVVAVDVRVQRVG